MRIRTCTIRSTTTRDTSHWRARRLRTRRRVRQVVARGRDAAIHLRLAPASVAVLRRFLRRELREQRTLWRRDHAGADSGDRDDLPRHQAAVGAHPVGRIDRRMDCPRPPDFLSRLLRRHLRELPRRGRLQLPPDRQHLQGQERLLHRHGWMLLDRPSQRKPDGSIVVDDEGREPLRADRRRPFALRRSMGYLGSRHTRPLVRMATRNASGTNRPARSTAAWRSNGRSTICSTF